MFETCSEFQFCSIKSVLIAGNVGKLFIGDHLVGYCIKVNLNQGHLRPRQSSTILATVEGNR